MFKVDPDLKPQIAKWAAFYVSACTAHAWIHQRTLTNIRTNILPSSACSHDTHAAPMFKHSNMCKQPVCFFVSYTFTSCDFVSYCFRFRFKLNINGMYLSCVSLPIHASYIYIHNINNSHQSRQISSCSRLPTYLAPTRPPP